MTGDIMQATRAEHGLTIRAFRAVIQQGMATKLSHGRVQMWLAGHIKPGYEDMYYLYTHTSEPWVKAMAADCMTALRPDIATADLEPVLPGPASDATKMG